MTYRIRIVFKNGHVQEFNCSDFTTRRGSIDLGEVAAIFDITRQEPAGDLPDPSQR